MWNQTFLSKPSGVEEERRGQDGLLAFVNLARLWQVCAVLYVFLAALNLEFLHLTIMLELLKVVFIPLLCGGKLRCLSIPFLKHRRVNIP